MSQAVTREHLHHVADGLRETIKENTREVISFVQESQRAQDTAIQQQFNIVNEHLDGINEQLEAIKETLAMRKELQNLVRGIKAHGMDLDDSKIFA